MNTQFFSIITPSFGQLDWLRCCVASVADQVVPGLRVEHIIQDGGSPGIEDFAREMGAEYYRDGIFIFGQEIASEKRGTYRLAIFTESDNGMYDALNKGIARIQGDLWAWLNSDEQYLPSTLAYAAKWFSLNPDRDILCGDALLTDEEGKALSYRRIIAPQWHHTRLVHLASLSCASFYRRSVIERGGKFDTCWRAIGDAEWMARLISKGIKIGTCQKLLSSFAFTGQNTSESPQAGVEGKKWRGMADAPSPLLRVPTVLIHRLRKCLAGSYASRSVEYALYEKQGSGRVLHSARQLGWSWPLFEEEESKKPNVEIADMRNDVEALNQESKNQGLSTISILGTPVLKTTYVALSNVLTGNAPLKKGALVVDFANTHIITMRKHETAFAQLTQTVDLTVPDGMPLVWAMNAKGAGLKDRVYGPTFTREFLDGCPDGFTHYLIGGSEECGRRFRERMLALNPNLNFVGGYHGFCSQEGVLADDEAVLEEILRKQPDFIWVGLGTPKQYAWIHRIKPLLAHGIMLAVGFAFDVNAGMKPDAPALMQRLGLTWLFRMGSEPKRLFGRYLKWNSLFLYYIFLEILFGEKGSTSSVNSTSTYPTS